MKNRNKLFLIICTLISYTSIAQKLFPESWLGKYQGDLMIYGVDSVKMKINMKLDIVKTVNDSIYDWTMIYNFKGKDDIRAYSLVVVDKEKGHYKIDENNSIIIDGYLFNDTVFTSFFQVMESYIISTYTKKEETIIFEIISGKSKPVSITGNITKDKEEIPQVDSYFVNGRQKAVLIKQ